MSQENKQCQNCKASFEIDASDFDFYERIKVPAPTFCPDCRFQRRLSFYNLVNLYRRKCDLCGEEKISMYAPESPYRVYCPQCWWSDKWDPFDYGRDCDFSRPFFEQLDELWHKVPLLGLSIDLLTSRISPYNNHAGNLKNCYLVFDANRSEDCAYGAGVWRCKSVFDCSIIAESEFCYDMMHSWRNNRCVGGRSQVTESINCFFLKDSANCQDCFASANLRNKKYHIFNKPHTKEDYEKEINKWDLGSYRTYEEVWQAAEKHWRQLPPKPHKDEHAVNCTGSHVFQSKNCKECYETGAAEDCKFIFDCGRVRDSYDISCWGDNLTLSYEGCVVGENSSNLKFCNEAGLTLLNAEYSKLSTGGRNHFGCVSVKKGDYVILNKRYTEEEFNKLREKIIAHMNEMSYTDKKGRIYKYGEFFPPEMSPFAYNETVAANFFPLTEEEAKTGGYRWREKEKQEHAVTLSSNDLPDHVRDAGDEILKEIIGCGSCGRGYRFIQMELDFLRQVNLPLSRECPFCRVNRKLEQWVRNLRVIPRVCDKCGSNFKTGYTKEEAPYILCKECYLNEFV